MDVLEWGLFFWPSAEETLYCTKHESYSLLMWFCAMLLFKKGGKEKKKVIYCPRNALFFFEGKKNRALFWWWKTQIIHGLDLTEVQVRILFFRNLVEREGHLDTCHSYMWLYYFSGPQDLRNRSLSTFKGSLTWMASTQCSENCTLCFFYLLCLLSLSSSPQND